MSHPDIIRLTVNGRARTVEGALDGENLLYVLRERLGLSGSKNACEQGECGSCTVLLDGRLVCGCLVLASSADGSDVVTVEGLQSQDGALTDVQRAFVSAGAVQCGFCTPGLVLAVHHLLDRNPAPGDLDIREAISGNLCRCTGYGRIIAAVWAVISERAAGGDARAAGGDALAAGGGAGAAGGDARAAGGGAGAAGDGARAAGGGAAEQA
jgi:aerobic carbon-monoxide dehydrogenase small subunit